MRDYFFFQVIAYAVPCSGKAEAMHALRICAVAVIFLFTTAVSVDRPWVSFACAVQSFGHSSRAKVSLDLQANAKAFRAGLPAKIAGNFSAVETASADKLDEAYARLTSLQAWRSFVLEDHLNPDVLGFFSEAQNDGLTSLVLVGAGLFRPALKSLRSVVENIIHCLYYMDHPVEYRQWEADKHRPMFRELFDYFERHPDIASVSDPLNPVAPLRATYRYIPQSSLVFERAK